MHNTVVADTMAFWGSVVDIHPTHDFGLSGLTEAEQKRQGGDPHYEPQTCPLEVRMDDLTHSHGKLQILSHQSGPGPQSASCLFRLWS